MVSVGVTDLVNAGAASLAAPAGIVAGVMTDWNVPAPVETDDLPLLQGCVVRDDLFVVDPEYGNDVMTHSDSIGRCLVSRDTSDSI